MDLCILCGKPPLNCYCYRHNSNIKAHSYTPELYGYTPDTGSYCSETAIWKDRALKAEATLEEYKQTFELNLEFKVQRELQKAVEERDFALNKAKIAEEKLSEWKQRALKVEDKLKEVKASLKIVIARLEEETEALKACSNCYFSYWGSANLSCSNKDGFKGHVPTDHKCKHWRIK